jgi:hypothetical protein
MYKLHKNSFNEISSVIRDDGSGCITSIPFAPDNTDYQAYLKWVEEGNTPELAEDN